MVKHILKEKKKKSSKLKALVLVSLALALKSIQSSSTEILLNTHLKTAATLIDLSNELYFYMLC